jgi:hypothetical protein
MKHIFTLLTAVLLDPLAAIHAADAAQTGIGTSRTTPADDWRVDFRYAPERWQTAICLPDDWQKSLVGKQGDLRYDYPGRCEGFKTRVLVGLDGAPSTWVRQELAGPRVPIVRTVKRCGEIEMREETFAVAPALAVWPTASGESYCGRSSSRWRRP